MTKRIGIDIGGTNIRFGLFDDSQFIAESRVEADFSNICKTLSPEDAWLKIVSVITQGIQAINTQYADIKAIGIGFPGFIEPDSGRVLQSPNLPGLFNVDLAGDIAKQLQQPVFIENDALCAAFGEAAYVKETPKNLIYFGLGTGVGGGLVYMGQPFTGQHGVAMEVGHLIVDPNGRLCGCGNRGCLEQYSSATGVAKTYSMLTGQKVSADNLALKAQQGDQYALKAYELAALYLAQAVAHTAKIVDIGQVVIGGGMSQAWPLMQKAFHARLEQDLIPVLREKVRVSISQCGDQAGMLGAALLAGSRSG